MLCNVLDKESLAARISETGFSVKPLQMGSVVSSLMMSALAV